jgi:uncharacterized protein YmfQ (DUF2313 family)
MKTITEATHTKGWVENWNRLLSLPETCMEDYRQRKRQESFQ